MSTDPSLVAGRPERVGAGALLADRYRVGERIGAGGMGSIYRARDELLGRDVAVKVLHPHLADDVVLRERFREEARHAAGLLHPNVVTVFDTGVAGLPYIVMELVDGPSLRDLLVARGRLSPPAAARLIGSVCTALARAHAAGIVHCDVKPENVLIAAGSDGQDTVKVADFGIARAVTETGSPSSDALVGSVHYMAPEVVDGLVPTPASDQYAVGVVLYELVTGLRPSPPGTPTAEVLRRAFEPLPPPSASDPHLPPALDRVVARATAQDPDGRYADVRELAGALAAAVAGMVEPATAASAATVAPATPGDDARHPDGSTLVIPPDALLTATAQARGDVRDRVYAPARRRLDRGVAGAVVAAVLALALASWALLGVLASDGEVAPPADAGSGAGDAAADSDGEASATAVEVPDVVGLPRDQAVAALRAAGLDVFVTEAYRDDEPRLGRVATQSVRGGGEARTGDDIGLVVSRGRLTVRVPDVRGQTVETATDRLETAGFQVVVVEQRRPRTGPLAIGRAGFVEEQEPGPLGELPRGGEITLTTYA